MMEGAGGFVNGVVGGLGKSRELSTDHPEGWWNVGVLA